MISSWRMFLCALITGATLFGVGCFASPHAVRENVGQGGATTTGAEGVGSTGGVEPGPPCFPGSPCGDLDHNSCTKEECMGGFCVTHKLTTDAGPGSTECTTIVCSNGAATPTSSVAGTACTLTDNANARVCDGNGACVECAADSDCKVGTLPRCDLTAHACISCSDGIRNGSEADVDCGGGACPECDGDTCASGSTCKSGLCANDVCCHQDCSGPCSRCDLPGEKGTCSSVPSGLYLADCELGTDVCDGNGVCTTTTLGKAGATCLSDADCSTGACNGMCRLPDHSPCTEHADCASLWCVANVCAACSNDSNCASNKCSMGRCAAPGGGVCSSDGNCAGGNCDNLTNLCGKSAGSACNNDSECTSHRCTGTSTCAPCSTDDDCASHSCDANKNCLLLSMAFCTAGAQCASSVCQGFPARCK